jgi:pSer/pThr/pTyr-binding forkhead associated (FHA) protein
VTSSSGERFVVESPSWLVGAAAAADLRLKQPGVTERHAELTAKGRQVFAKALVGGFVLDDSRSWLDGAQMRPNVAYVLGSGARLEFGAQGGVSYTVEFEEGSGANPLVEMLMQGGKWGGGDAAATS